MLKSLNSAIFIFFLFLNIGLQAQEICDNGIDDDGDGLIDLNDSADCICEGEWAWSFSIIDLSCGSPSFFSLATDFLDADSYQWYRDGIALADENDPIYLADIIRDGEYILQIEISGNCFASEPYTLKSGDIRVDITDTLCLDETYEFDGFNLSTPGTYFGDFEASNGCDSIVHLTLELHDCGDTIRNLNNLFKQKLIQVGIDTNGDGRIQYEEAAGTDTLHIPRTEGSSISNFKGLEYFYNLEYLDISFHSTLSLKLDSLKKLKHLNVQNNNMSDLDFSMLNQIEYLNISSTLIRNVDVSHLSELKYYIHKINRADIIDLRNNPKLIEVDLERDLSLDSIYLGSHPDLKKFRLTSSEIAELDLSGAPQLEDLTLTQCKVDSGIDVSQNTKLKKLILRLSPVDPNFDASPLTELEYLQLQQGGLESIDLNKNIKLEHLDLYDNLDLSAVDLSNNTLLRYVDLGRCDLNNHILDLSSNSQLDSLSVFRVKQLLIKNGSIESYLDLWFGSQYEFICVDEEQYEAVKAEVGLLTPVHSFCYFEEGSPSYSLTGNVDLSANGIDCSEIQQQAPSLKLFIESDTTNGYIFFSDDYQAFLPGGELCLTSEVFNSDYYTVVPEKVNITFPDDGQSYTQDYCVLVKDEVVDISTQIIPIGDARPGFNSSYKIIYKNEGTLPTDGEIQFNFDDELMSLIHFDSIPNDSIGPNLVWQFENLQVFEERQINLTFLNNSPMDSPALEAGDTIRFDINLITDNDVNIENNTDSLRQTVVNSFDPNDKLCLQGTKISPIESESSLQYRIRFENTGTANAIHVVVKDFIDPDKFDISTIRPLNASHDYTLQVVNNTAEFIFSEINLSFVDSLNDGYIFFEVKPQEGILSGDIIANTAEIFFDFNFPIVTNTYETLVFDETISSTYTTDIKYAKVFPSIVSDKVKVQADGILNIVAYDANGKIHKKSSFESIDEIDFDMSYFNTGIYFLYIESKLGFTIEKVIKH